MFRTTEVILRLSTKVCTDLPHGAGSNGDLEDNGELETSQVKVQNSQCLSYSFHSLEQISPPPLINQIALLHCFPTKQHCSDKETLVVYGSTLP